MIDNAVIIFTGLFPEVLREILLTAILLGVFVKFVKNL